MTRKSKIARLPRTIRDELNRRLDNGQPGIHLVQWLNSLPEVNEILARDFEGHRITPQNLSEWKRGGYRDWVAQQECRAGLQDWLADAKELGTAASPEALTNAMMTFVTVRYAAAMYDCDYEAESREKLRLLSPILNDVIRLRNCDLAQQRFDLDTQKLALNTEKLEFQVELARQRMEIERAHLELDRQNAPATTVGQASRLSPSSSPALSVADHTKANPAQLPSAPPRNMEHLSASRLADATRNTPPPPASPGPIDSSKHAKTPLQINALQPNPTKSNNIFFIFSQTAKSTDRNELSEAHINTASLTRTLGQASRLSPSSLALSPGTVPSGATESEGHFSEHVVSSPSPPRSGGEGRGEVVLRAQGENQEFGINADPHFQSHPVPSLSLPGPPHCFTVPGQIG